MNTSDYIAYCALAVSLITLLISVRGEYCNRRRRFLEVTREFILAVAEVKIEWQNSQNELYHQKMRIKKINNSEAALNHLSLHGEFILESQKNIEKLEALIPEFSYGKIKESDVYSQTSTIQRIKVSLASNNKEMVRKLNLIQG